MWLARSVTFVILIIWAQVGFAARSAPEERRYYISEERSYGPDGNAGIQAVVVRRTDPAGGGAERNRFYAAGGFGYDELVGTLALDRREQLVATFTTSPDRRLLTSGRAGLPNLRDAAAAGAAQGHSKVCSTWQDNVELAVPGEAAGVGNVALKISMRPVEQGCLISWEARNTALRRNDGSDVMVDFRGVALSDTGFELIASHSGFATDRSAGLNLNGHRGVFLIGSGKERRGQAQLLGLAGFEDGRPNRSRPTSGPEAGAAALDSARASSITGLIEMVALAYAEGRANPLPLIAGTFFVIDNVTATLINAAGAGILGVNAIVGGQNPTASRVGNAMLGYPGLIGGAVSGIAEAVGGPIAGDVAGLAYATATVFTPKGATNAINRAFTTAALEHMLTRGGTAAGRLGEIMIDLGAQSQNVRDWLSQTNLAAQYLDQFVDWADRWSSNQNGAALDLAGQQGASQVSTTPSSRDGMSDLEFADLLRQITDPRSPFNQTTSGDFSESTGGLSDVIISGVLTFRLFDHAVEDGDLVSLNVSGSGRTVLAGTISLTNAGQNFNTGVGSGQAVITITALNLGDLVPNTGAISVTSPIVSGNGSQLYNLQVGQTGVMRVLVLGRRARIN